MMLRKACIFFLFLTAFAVALSRPVKAGTLQGALLQTTGKGSSAVLLVMSGGKVEKIKLSQTTLVSRGEKGVGFRSANTSDLQPGDQLTVETDSKGTAKSVSASYAVIQGQVRTVLKGKILLADGRLVDLNPNVKVVTESGTGIALSVLRRDDYVRLRQNPASGEIWKVVLADDAAPLMITAISHNYSSPLDTGETVTVTMEGTPGGTATFSIAGVASDVGMSETSSGKYLGKFTVTEGTARASSTPVIGKLSRDGRTVGPIQASRLVTIGQKQPPAVVVTEVKHTPRQPDTPTPRPTYIPVQTPPRNADAIVISRPQRGAFINDPLIIVGRAKPGCKLRTTVTYSNDMTGLLRLEGKLCSEEVRADSEGSFRSSPIRIPQAYAGKDLDISIKVEILGEESAPKPVVIKVRRK